VIGSNGANLGNYGSGSANGVGLVVLVSSGSSPGNVNGQIDDSVVLSGMMGSASCFALPIMNSMAAGTNHRASVGSQSANFGVSSNVVVNRVTGGSISQSSSNVAKRFLVSALGGPAMDVLGREVEMQELLPTGSYYYIDYLYSGITNVIGPFSFTSKHWITSKDERIFAEFQGNTLVFEEAVYCLIVNLRTGFVHRILRSADYRAWRIPSDVPDGIYAGLAATYARSMFLTGVFSINGGRCSWVNGQGSRKNSIPLPNYNNQVFVAGANAKAMPSRLLTFFMTVVAALALSAFT
jgi:hypothetical protein